jgi:DNA-binding NtrC family response regulator
VVLAEGDSVGLAEFPQIAAQASMPPRPQVPAHAGTHHPAPAGDFISAQTAQPPHFAQSGEAEVSEPDLFAAELADEPPLSPAEPTASFDALPLLDAAGEVRPLEDVEAELIRYAIAHYRGQMSEVARRLRIGRSTLYRKLESLGLSPAAPSGRGIGGDEAEASSEGVAAERQP